MLRPLIFYDGDETHGGAGAPEPEVDTGAVQQAAQEATKEATPQPGPWAADLNEYFADETARQAADRYMREKIQPRITQLEQETAPARELYNDLINDPTGTLRNVIDELYGEDVAEAFMDLFEPDDGDVGGDDDQNGSGENEVPAWFRRYGDFLEQQMAEAQKQEAQTEYEKGLKWLREQHPDLTDDDVGNGKDKAGLIHPFISAAGGDLEAGYRAYNAWKQQFIQTYGQAPTADNPEGQSNQAPAVLGTESAGDPPPIKKQYKSLDEALDDFIAEQRKSPPPAVGSV